MLLPDDGIGVVVLTNTSSSAMAPVVAYRVLDELLGLEPLDWFGDFKPRFDAAVAGMREARAPAGSSPARRRPGRCPPTPASTSTPATARSPSPSTGTPSSRPSARMDLSLAHRHYETFDLEWHELGDQSHIFPLMFLSDPDGDITRPHRPVRAVRRTAALRPGARTPGLGTRRCCAGCAAPTPWARSRSWSPCRATAC